ncbi:bacillithiol biosynthesis cysteine-adding enzyme BshC [Oceanobacillus salinisoli]|uniref:bacillithiol biosynthesis cysteine-adding enzyme BshC n=1 Tax=Oceanobacillus salinisoli TaxID=2678611 RepID=UPI0012E2AC53|nr:bacillithiol biosynthesis cysteine-adding enzyme BshC [Oceanobacillus salinisoli]
MWIDPIRIYNQSKIVSDYRSNKQDILDFFEYIPSENLEQRLKDLKKRTFQRDSLTEVLYKMNKQWGAPSSTLHNVDRLSDENSVVVIAGQQAGLLTGPMYTINKIISIIQLAKRQEEKLDVPVIPVFWIAGEDHDFDEINHIYLQKNSRMKKYKVAQQVTDKRSVSDIELDKEEMLRWLKGIFLQIEETEYTITLYESIIDCLEQSATYTDFFARLIYSLFPEEGLVLMDSAHPLVRRMESKHFVYMIEKQNELSSGVCETMERLKAQDYHVPLEVELSGGNLFYHQGKERILLFRNEYGDWIGKQNEVVLSTEELIQIAEKNPEKLSNNVVTRPVMQELLFPSLAFIGGPGEISYWAALKPAFHAFDIKMPPVLPRLSFTYIDSKVNKVLKHFSLTPSDVINNGVTDYKKAWIDSKTHPPIRALAEEIKDTVGKAHQPLRTLAKEIRSDIGDLADKNLFYLHKEITFLEERMIRAVEEKYEKDLEELNLIQLFLYPDGLQERVWNPLPIINKYGTDFIKETLEYSCSFSNDHYLVYL